jgi:hypothetical protein
LINTLMTLGISKKALPLDLDEKVDLTNHRAFLKLVESLEDEEANLRYEGASAEVPLKPLPSLPTKVLVPGGMDIFLGRGRHPKSAPGNLRLNQLLAEHLEAYDNSPRREKSAVADIVLKQIKESGCRLLRLVVGRFEECDDTEAQDKICHDFRNCRMRHGGGLWGYKWREGQSGNEEEAKLQSSLTMVLVRQIAALQRPCRERK